MKISTLLSRQLRKVGLDEETMPRSSQEWMQVLERVDRGYEESDKRIEILEHSIAMSTSESDAKLNRIARNFPGMIFEMLVRPDGSLNLLYASSGAGELFECELIAQSLEIATFATCIKARHRRRILATMVRSVRQKSPWKLEWEITTPLQKSKWLEGHARPFEGENGGMFLVGAVIDITLQKETERLLENERVLSINSAKMATLGEMAGGIAHEINNPLAIIHLKAQILHSKIQKGGYSQEDILNELNKIRNTADRIAKIIRGLRSFSRNSEDDAMESTAVMQIIDDTLELCGERFRAHDVELRVKCATNFTLECRAAQISQVVMNLLSNAFDAIMKLDEKWVEIEIKSDGVRLTIAVTDSGWGISPQLAGKIMQPFFTTKDVGKGTGLGLSISKGISENHQGTLTVDSNSPRTRFVLELPLAQAQPLLLRAVS